MATLRVLAIRVIRQASYPIVAAAIRKIKHDTGLLLTILGINDLS